MFKLFWQLCIKHYQLKIKIIIVVCISFVTQSVAVDFFRHIFITTGTPTVEPKILNFINLENLMPDQ